MALNLFRNTNPSHSPTPNGVKAMIRETVWKIQTLIFLAWLTMIGLAWILAEVYMPAVRSIGGVSFLVDLAMWLGVFFIVLCFLILFRKAFYKLFWAELQKRKQHQL